MTHYLPPVCLLTIGIALASAAEPDVPLPIRPPGNPATPIVAIEFEDHQTHSRGGNGSFLAIYADGRAVVSAPGNAQRQITGQIPQQELNHLLQDLLVEHRLWECRTSQLQEQIRSARNERQRPEPGRDAAATVIRIRSADRSHEIRCHALGLTASQLPELRQVRDVYASQQRLENIAAIIRAGGYENVNAVLSAANRRLKQSAPQTQSLTPRDLNLVDLRPDGTRYLQFSRIPDIDGLRPAGGLVMVSVYQAPGRPPEITVTADPS